MKISDILISLAEVERDVEVTRQVITENREYNAFQIFSYIDSDKKNYVEELDIINYLKSKNIFVTEIEARLVILYYDHDLDKVLNFDEFINLIESKSSPKRERQEITGPICFAIDYALTKLLEKEVLHARKILNLFADVRGYSDFDIHDIFHLIKNNDNINCIIPQNLMRFLNNTFASFIDQDIDLIFNRLDLNKDKAIDLCEFHIFFGYPNCGYSCPFNKCENCGIECCRTCRIDGPCYVHQLVRNDDDKHYKDGHMQRRIYRTYCTEFQRRNNDQDQNNRENPEFNNGIQKISQNLTLKMSPKREYGPIEVCLNSGIDDNDGYNDRNNYTNNNLTNYNNKDRNNYTTSNITNYNNNIDKNNYTNNNLTNYNNNDKNYYSPNDYYINNNNSDFNTNNSNTLNQKRIDPNNNNNYNDNFIYQQNRDMPNFNNNQKYMDNYRDNYRDNTNDNIIINKYTKNSFENDKENNENININNSYENLRNKSNQQEKDQNRKKNEYEEDQFIDYLKQAMLLESKIEQLKIDLSLRSDFNWEQIFRIFELEGRGYLEKEDLISGFNKFDLRPKDLDIALLLKRYDLKKEGQISYPNFFELIVPFSKSHRLMVDKRKISDESGSVLANPNEFSPETLNCIKNLFVNIFNGEFILNKMRESFTNLKIKFSDIFHLLDREGNGFVDEKGLLDFMKKNGVFSSNNDCDLLFLRLNKLRNGKIDFQEMCGEIEAVYQ